MEHDLEGHDQLTQLGVPGDDLQTLREAVTVDLDLGRVALEPNLLSVVQTDDSVDQVDHDAQVALIRPRVPEPDFEVRVERVFHQSSKTTIQDRRFLRFCQSLAKKRLA